MSRRGDPAFPGSVEAVIFDMDGTLVESYYDWPAIRAELGVEGPSLVDALNALPEPSRTAAWSRLGEIEDRASRAADVVDGARDLLELLRTRGIKTALVTNNTSSNARRLAERFSLRFDVVLTRDCGLFKPSGAPMLEAMRQLGVDASRTMTVGDSMYDIRAAREAGCAWVVAVNGGAAVWGDKADLALAKLRDLEELVLARTDDSSLTEAARNSDADAVHRDE